MALRFGRVSIYGLAFLLALACTAEEKPSKLRRLVKRQATPQMQCPGYRLLMPDPADCSSYFQCENNIVTRQFCPEGSVFSPETGDCGSYDIPGCLPPSSFIAYQTPISYQCPRADGRFQDTSDCSRYYLCTANQPQRQQCPRDQMFDPNAQLCSDIIEPEGCHMPDINPFYPSPPRTGEPGKYQCQQSHGTYHDTTDCSKYYVCSHWQPIRRQCPWPQLFDPVTQICSSTARPIGCHMMRQGEIVTALFPCPTAYGSFQDSSDCSRYWICSNNQATSTPCPPGQLFDINISQCGTLSFVAGCIMPPGTQTPGFPCPTAYGSFQDASDCSRYWSCSNNQATSTPCPPGQLFDTNRSQCSLISFVNGCVMPPGFVSPAIQTPGFLCPRPTGEFSYKEDCSQFWRCDNNQAVLRRCQGSFVFNPARGYCDWQGSLGPYPRECRLISNTNPIWNGMTCPNDGFAHLLAHPRFCNAFYICGGGRVNMPCVFCGQNTYFDQRAMVCAPALSVDLASVCLGKTMMPHFNKTMAQSQGC